MNKTIANTTRNHCLFGENDYREVQIVEHGWRISEKILLEFLEKPVDVSCKVLRCKIHDAKAKYSIKHFKIFSKEITDVRFKNSKNMFRTPHLTPVGLKIRAWMVSIAEVL